MGREGKEKRNRGEQLSTWMRRTESNQGNHMVGNVFPEKRELREIGSEMSSHNNNSTSANDPRQPSAAKPYVAQPVSPQDLPVDYSGFIAVIFGIAGVMFRYKLSSWLAIIFCAQSLANMKNVENDLKQISMAMMFAIMGLVTNYFGPARPGKQS